MVVRITITAKRKDAGSCFRFPWCPLEERGLVDLLSLRFLWDLLLLRLDLEDFRDDVWPKDSGEIADDVPKDSSIVSESISSVTTCNLLLFVRIRLPPVAMFELLPDFVNIASYAVDFLDSRNKTTSVGITQSQIEVKSSREGFKGNLQ